MVAVNVAGIGGWQGCLWLSVASGDTVTGVAGGSKRHLLLEKCLLSKSDWKQVRLNLQEQKDSVLTFELRVGESRSTDVLHFLMGWSVDLTQWIESGATKRWYEIRNPRAGGEATNSPGYCENMTDLKSSAAYVSVGIAGIESPGVEAPLTQETPTHKPTFQFVLPYRSLRNTRLRSIRVGRIVHELRTENLHDLLPLTLYSRRSQGPFRTNKLEDSGNGMTKALVLLQLSCQYANYCVDELDRYSNKLNNRKIKLQSKINQLKHRQNLLKEQKANLQREADVLRCSHDGMQSLLRELDPETHACLQNDSNTELQDDISSKV